MRLHVILKQPKGLGAGVPIERGKSFIVNKLKKVCKN